jgi:hypothetical protein
MDKAKIIVVVTALALGLSLSAAAQQDATSASSSAHPSETPTRTAEITIRGCISGGKRYTFMQASTGEMFALAGKADRFASARGKLIEITANEFAPEAKSDQLPELRVNILRVIADKCPIQAHPEPRMPNPAATSPGPPPPASSPATRPHEDPGTVNQKPPNVNNPNISGDTGAPSPGTGNPPPNSP